jgi:hypothetical protein
MKNLIAWVSCLMVAGNAFAQTTPADKSTSSTSGTTSYKSAPASKSSGIRIVLPDDKPKAPAAKTSVPANSKAAEKAAKEKKEETPKIEGMEIARGGDKGFLGIEIAGACFKIHFYDAKKKPVEPDMTSALLRWDPKNKIGSERVVLLPAEKMLTSPRNIQPPYNFKLFISMLKPPAEGADPVVAETYTIDFRQ